VSPTPTALAPPPEVWVAAPATNRLGFLRFHGRNAETWEARTQTSPERFDYYYQSHELDEWVSKIDGLAAETDQLHLIMNTNNFDQGPSNARLLRERLRGGGVAIAEWRPVEPADPEEPADSRQGRLL
jgi:uncharacterized protein YecE (DUF72 family)